MLRPIVKTQFIKQAIFLLCGFSLLIGCTKRSTQEGSITQVAFLADVHIQDIYGSFSDNQYKGLTLPGTDTSVLIRTMESQLGSTRLFNENYFTFISALNDIRDRGIKIVVLPGDFSDDGQAVHLRGIAKLLSHYESDYKMRFYLTVGNHDAVRPFLRESGKSDFLGKEGAEQPIYSMQREPSGTLPVVVSKDIACSGYKELLDVMGPTGFSPHKEDLYWATPFSNYLPESYSYDLGLKASLTTSRQYQPISSDVKLFDASYVAEPVEGIWLLAIDGNVYRKKEGKTDGTKAEHYEGPSIGYRDLFQEKPFLIDWVEQVGKQAKQRGKTLIAFSHYPMVDFYNHASSSVEKLMGVNKFQLHRIPPHYVAKRFAEAGVRLHFAGHMHVNDTGIEKLSDSVGLVNVQVPSLAAYVPAYKIATLQNSTTVEVETVVLDSVPGFKTLFPLYEMEYKHLVAEGKTPWNHEILRSNSYREFTDWHLKELVRSHLLQKEWSTFFQNTFVSLTGAQIVERLQPGWKSSQSSEELEKWNGWTGYDMILDFYRLRSADGLALAEIGETRLFAYNDLVQLVGNTELDSKETKTPYNEIVGFLEVFRHFLHDSPSVHFTIDLKNGTVSDR